MTDITSRGRSQTSTDAAIEFTSNACFHRCLILPATTKHGLLRVTYATTTNFEAENAKDLPALLCCGGMGAPRYMIYDFNHIAKNSGVKMITVDRPGFGGSTPVPLEQRVDVWLETVEHLLRHLRIEHVSLISHSAGTIYLLNTILRLPEVLDPEHPYVALLAPWVHPNHSSVGLSNAFSKLPQSWVGNLGAFQKFVSANIIPSVGYSSGILESVANTFRDNTSVLEEDAVITLTYGYDKSVWGEVAKLQSQYFRAEDNSGMGQEALVCLEKGGSSWGACSDYPKYIDALVQQLKARQESVSATGDASPKLHMTMMFSETDMLIGKGGQKYFEQCWEKGGVSDVVDFRSVTVPRTNHDTIWLPTKGGIALGLYDLKAVYSSDNLS